MEEGGNHKAGIERIMLPSNIEHRAALMNDMMQVKDFQCFQAADPTTKGAPDPTTNNTSSNTSPRKKQNNDQQGDSLHPLYVIPAKMLSSSIVAVEFACLSLLQNSSQMGRTQVGGSAATDSMQLLARTFDSRLELLLLPSKGVDRSSLITSKFEFEVHFLIDSSYYAY